MKCRKFESSEARFVGVGVAGREGRNPAGDAQKRFLRTVGHRTHVDALLPYFRPSDRNI